MARAADFDSGRNNVERKRCRVSILLTDPGRDGTVPEPGAGAGGVLIQRLSNHGEAAAPLVARFDSAALAVVPGVQPPICLFSHPDHLVG